MDRKHCVLLYSNYSKASIDLLSYIKELPLDFPKVTGMTMICIDNDTFKETLRKNNIEYVPTLLVEYYKGATSNQTKQKLEHDYIYMWIDQVMKALHFEWPQVGNVSNQDPVGRRVTPLGAQTQQPHPAAESPQQSHDIIDIPPPTPHEDVPQIQKKAKKDITTLAQEMAKDRDSYISDTTPEHKKQKS